MLVHSVYFWLKPALTQEQHAAFRQGLESLQGIETLRFFHVGLPTDSDRPVVERSYTFALVTSFEDKSGLDTYQVHPLHLAFLDEYKENWERLQVFDCE